MAQAKLMKSLEKGNIQQVTFVREGKEEKMFVSANPQYKTLDLYNAKMENNTRVLRKKRSRGKISHRRKRKLRSRMWTRRVR